MQTKGIQGAMLLSGVGMSQPSGVSIDVLPGVVSKDNMVYTTEQMVPVTRYEIANAVATGSSNSSSPVYFQRFDRNTNSTNGETGTDPIRRVIPTSRKIKSEFNQDDDAKLYLRRKRNREAAARCRQRRLDLIGTLSEQVNKLNSEKSQLESQLEQAHRERAELMQTLKTHAATCDLADKAFMKPLVDEFLPPITDSTDQTVPAYSTPPPPLPPPRASIASSGPSSIVASSSSSSSSVCSLPSISNAYPVDASALQGIPFSSNMVLLVNDTKSGVIKSANFVPYGSLPVSSISQQQPAVPSRPSTLEIMGPANNFSLETPSTGTFTFDPKITALLNESTGLTPTLGTGLTPLVSNSIAQTSVSLETPTITSTSFVSL